MASMNITHFLQRHTPKIACVLIFTFLEWTSISLLFLNCILFFLIVKSASSIGLQTPCIHCSLSFFRISFNNLICNDHMTRISKFKRAQRKKHIKETEGFDYIIYGPPWRVVKHAKNGNFIHKSIKREGGKDHFFFVEEGDHKPDTVKDNSMEPMHTRCIIDEERLIPVELIDEVTMEDSSIWFNQEKQHKREFTENYPLMFLQARDGKKARDSISVENDSLRKNHIEERVNKTANQSRNVHSYSSLFDIAPTETTPFSNICIRSEPPSPQLSEDEEHNKNKLYFSSKPLVKRNKENTDRGILYREDQNINSYQPIFEVTPNETTSLVNPDIASEHISDKYDELDASLIKGNDEEIKGEMLIKFGESLEKFEEERCSIKEKLNRLEQRLLIVQMEEREPENTIEEAKPNLQMDYKSLSDFLNREMNYSTNDLVSLGKGYNQRRDGNLKVKRHLTSLDGFTSKKGSENSLQVSNVDAGTKEHEKLTIEEEIDKFRDRLEHVNADRELIRHSVKSLKKTKLKASLMLKKSQCKCQL